MKELRGTQYSSVIADAFLSLCDVCFIETLRDTRLNASLHTVVENFSVEVELPVIWKLCTVFMKIIDVTSTSTSHHS